MNRSRTFLSRPPHCEPPLDDRAAHSAVERVSACTALPLHATRRSSHSGRSTPPLGRAAERSAADAAAQRFAEHALRLALEVLDRRRPATHLQSVALPTVVDMLRYRARAATPGDRLGVAVLGAVRTQGVGDTALEVFATYARGPRVFALAGRITSTGDQQAGWRVTSLQIG